MSSSCVFLGEDHFCFLDRKVISYLQEKEIPSWPNIQKFSYFYVFYWERWSSVFHLKNKIISVKRNIIFSDNARKIVFQCEFFFLGGRSSFSYFWSRISLGQISAFQFFSVFRHPRRGPGLGNARSRFFVVFVFASYEKPWREFKSKVLRNIIIVFENSYSTYRQLISSKEPFALGLHWQ